MKTKKNNTIQFRCDSEMLAYIDSLSMFKRSEAIRFLLKKAKCGIDNEYKGCVERDVVRGKSYNSSGQGFTS